MIQSLLLAAYAYAAGVVVVAADLFTYDARRNESPNWPALAAVSLSWPVVLLLELAASARGGRR